MDFHIRIHHWVLWWISLGIGCGVIVVSNILLGGLMRQHQDLFLLLGALYWLKGGLVCWALEAVEVSRPGSGESWSPRIETPHLRGIG